MFRKSLLPRSSAPRQASTRRAATSVALLTTAVVVGACGAATAGTGSGGARQADPSTVNLGYLINFTHAPALIEVTKGYFQDGCRAEPL